MPALQVYVAYNKKDKMPTEFKQLLLETINELKNHPDAQDGVGFVTTFDEEPDWKVILSFVPIKKPTENMTH